MSISIGTLLNNVLQAWVMLVVLWCLLSWFPNIRWYEQPWKGLDMLVQPVIAPFRKLIPPISGIDLSPMVAIMVLQLVCKFLISFIP